MAAESSPRYSTDTRTLRPGDVYVAIRGERLDGHDFVGAAVERGAAAVVVDRDVEAPDGVEVVRVDDSIGHLTALASERLARSGAQVVAITGSVGKTTTRAAVVAVLREGFPVVAAEGNLNTPLGLSLLVLNAELDSATKVVMEMGARSAGDIAELVALFPPTVSVVTTVKGVHLETFGTIERIEHEKGEIIAGLPDTGTAILNADDPRVRAMAARTGARCLFYGRADDADLRPDLITVELPMLGEHAVTTALAAAAVGRALGLDDATINRGLARIAPEKGRLVRLPGRNGSVLIDDTYNASPDAVLAAIEVLRGFTANRRLAFLGDMLELGTDEEPAHAAVLDAALDVADVVVVVGPRLARAVQALEPARRSTVRAFASSTDVVEALAGDASLDPQAGDVALVKGSQGMRMERVSAALLAPEIDPASVLPRQSEAWLAQ